MGGDGYQEARGSVVLDSSGNVYFAGRYGIDGLVSKFDSSGNSLWSVNWDAGGADMF